MTSVAKDSAAGTVARHSVGGRVENKEQRQPLQPPADVQTVIAPPRQIVDLAVEVAGWSPCRSKRGVVIFIGENVLSHGHNYKPRGFECDGSDSCKATCRVEAIHAEQQAIVNAGGRPRTAGADLLHVKAIDGRLVPSGGPSCVQCSKLAVAVGIAGVWLYHAEGWKRYDAAEFHRLSLAALVSPSPSEKGEETTSRGDGERRAAGRTGSTASRGSGA